MNCLFLFHFPKSSATDYPKVKTLVVLLWPLEGATVPHQKLAGWLRDHPAFFKIFLETAPAPFMSLKSPFPFIPGNPALEIHMNQPSIPPRLSPALSPLLPGIEPSAPSPWPGYAVRWWMILTFFKFLLTHGKISTSYQAKWMLK